MVKNDTGGNKGKGLARKHVNAAKCGSSKQLRVATDEAEKYAVVSKMLGNGMCYVRLLSGGGERLCIIRNKFKGRGKRDNIIESGSWVLIGMREWSSKQDTCDLLEVYNPNERDRLLKNEPCFKSVTAEANSSGSAASIASSSVQFADSTTMKYSSMLNKRGSDEDDEDESMMQPRVYDMPPSDDEDDDDDDEDQEDEDEEDEDEEDEDQEDEDQEDEDDDAIPSPPIPIHKIKVARAAEINVDDI
jgi:translation initiation factor IF-1